MFNLIHSKIANKYFTENPSKTSLTNKYFAGKKFKPRRHRGVFGCRSSPGVLQLPSRTGTGYTDVATTTNTALPVLAHRWCSLPAAAATTTSTAPAPHARIDRSKRRRRPEPEHHPRAPRRSSGSEAPMSVASSSIIAPASGL
jgi:hypothetical protein